MCPKYGGVRISEAPVEFPVGVATRTRLFSTTWPRFWNSGLLRVGEKAPKALLVTSTIDISKNAA